MIQFQFEIHFPEGQSPSYQKIAEACEKVAGLEVHVQRFIRHPDSGCQVKPPLVSRQDSPVWWDNLHGPQVDYRIKGLGYISVTEFDTWLLVGLKNSYCSDVFKKVMLDFGGEIRLGENSIIGIEPDWEDFRRLKAFAEYPLPIRL
ncbi:MAG: hypothetical protein AAFV07_16085, partial [Bacteroidota bacterium]